MFKTIQKRDGWEVSFDDIPQEIAEEIRYKIKFLTEEVES